MADSLSLFDLAFPDSPDPALERDHAAGFKGLLCGVDEAGRGPWAGPVVAAAVILDYDRIPEGLNDSKLLTQERREDLYEKILLSGHVSVASASPATIDRLNIRGATLASMVRAVNGLVRIPDYVLVDGRDVPAGLKQPGQALVKGDGRCLCVAAASIVAKVTRDRMMVALEKLVPGYGFAQHKGYGVPQHQTALDRLGPSQYHRMSFRPVRLAAGVPD
ncbi:ribonuclease HII [Roseibium salinum]|uniref:ribonuclease HII n=1 Tax=Roseibium salinum TaxID=1604349 RepID=UPI0035ECD94A